MIQEASESDIFCFILVEMLKEILDAADGLPNFLKLKAGELISEILYRRTKYLKSFTGSIWPSRGSSRNKRVQNTDQNTRQVYNYIYL